MVVAEKTYLLFCKRFSQDGGGGEDKLVVLWTFTHRPQRLSMFYFPRPLRFLTEAGDRYGTPHGKWYLTPPACQSCFWMPRVCCETFTRLGMTVTPFFLASRKKPPLKHLWSRKWWHTLCRMRGEWWQFLTGAAILPSELYSMSWRSLLDEWEYGSSSRPPPVDVGEVTIKMKALIGVRRFAVDTEDQPVLPSSAVGELSNQCPV